MDRLFFMDTAEDIKKGNPTSSDLPVIGIAFDWRRDANTGKNVYIDMITSGYRHAFRNAGAELYVIDFDDKLEDFKDKLDGYVIPGGRDIHPRYYGEEVNGAVVGDQPEVHYGFNEAVYHGLPKACPLMGICWGFQFLNVINGGTMIQDIPDKMEHYKKRRMTVKPGTWLQTAIGDYALGSCYHHQALNRIAPNIEVAAYDDQSGLVHAIELKDPERFVVGVLWHPEISFKDESASEFDETSVNLLKGFIEKCRDYKTKKQNIESRADQ